MFEQRDVARGLELLGPFTLAGDREAWDAIGRMPDGPERGEAEALLEIYPAEMGGGDDDEVLVDLRSPGPGGGGTNAPA